MKLTREIDYERMTLEEAYYLYESQNTESECDADKHKVFISIKYSYKPVHIKRGV